MREDYAFKENFMERVATILENAKRQLPERDFKEFILEAEELVKDTRYNYGGVNVVHTE